jgi:putative hydrolase of the HAD superfamily
MDDRLYRTEMRNLEHFGYGIKAFALSMIETAIELTEGHISAHDIQDIVDSAKEMLAADVELLEHAAETIANLAAHYTLMLITKGDLRDQEAKIARSGLAQHFRHIEIVSDKSRETYLAILARHTTLPGHFLMVGNSLRSDILPVLELGAHAVYIPHELTWAHEAAAAPPGSNPRFHKLEDLGQLRGLVDSLEQQASTES